jgi:dihydroorotate dehydrogenase electron transfer subunit
MSPRSEPVITRGLILENRALAENTFTLTLGCPEARRFKQPGAFVKLRAWPELAEGGGPVLDRPFSIHQAEADSFKILYRVVGRATRLMSALTPGTSVKITGPLGRTLPEAGAGGADFYLVAGGVGLAPMAEVRAWLLAGGARADLFYGERRGAWQVDKAWLSNWAGDFTATVEDGRGYGQKGLVTEALAEALARAPRPVFACGPTPMLAAIASLAEQFKIPAWVSLEAGMACGLGVCLTCSLPLKGGGRFRVCREGPVVEAAAVAWEELR